MAKRSTTYEERMQIVERHIKGESLPKIASSMSIHKDTARKWWRRYRHQSWAGLFTQYGPPSNGPLSQFDPLIKYVALRLKLEHPGWGLDVLLLHMSRRPSLRNKPLPKRTALYHYLKPYYSRIRSTSRYPTHRPKEAPHRKARIAHQRWQMDFKGSMKVLGLGNAMAFNLCDEFSSMPLQGVVYAHPHANPLTNVRWPCIQNNLRQAFQKWGKPLELKMDRDPLFIGSTRFEWPGALLLWLIGLGIQPIINPKARPTRNANVERLNRTWSDQVGLTTIPHSKDDLQKATNIAWEDKRMNLPSRNPNCKNQPPLIALPQLKHSKRYFNPKKEAQTFDIKKVDSYLKKWIWKRQIDTHGRISLGGNQRAISKNHIGQIVKVLFVPKTRSFNAIDLNGTILKTFSIPSISVEYLTQIRGAT